MFLSNCFSVYPTLALLAYPICQSCRSYQYVLSSELFSNPSPDHTDHNLVVNTQNRLDLTTK